jgi:hypothetical protein
MHDRQDVELIAGSTPTQPINNDATSSAPELTAERVFIEADGLSATDR